MIFNNDSLRIILNLHIIAILNSYVTYWWRFLASLHLTILILRWRSFHLGETNFSMPANI